MKGPKLFVTIGMFAAVLVGTAWLLLPSGSSFANAALAEYQIEKLTCGSCVSNIRTALSGVAGVGDVEVNLTSNRGRVTFDPFQVDSAKIGETITAAGYPAKLRVEMSPDQYTALQQEQDQFGPNYVARIGERLLSRADFEKMVAQRVGGVISQGQEDLLWQRVWGEVLQRELLLSSAEKNQIFVQPGEVDVRIDELKQGHQGLEELVVKRYGSMEVFRDIIREDMIINRNIENNVYQGAVDERERQNRLQAWYADLQANTDVVIYDQKLKAASKGGGGCGGGCCS